MKKRHTPEQIVAKLPQADIELVVQDGKLVRDLSDVLVDDGRRRRDGRRWLTTPEEVDEQMHRIRHVDLPVAVEIIVDGFGRRRGQCRNPGRDDDH